MAIEWLQEIFDPIDFTFEWLGDWYTFDYHAGARAAQAARQKRVKELRKAGYDVRCDRLANQLISKGGIGSGKPHIELVVTCYMLNAYR